VHGVEDAAAVDADGAVDYLIFGHVFETVSKPGRAAAGPFGLAAVAAATVVPVLAVGGVTAETAGRVARAGASGIAAIGLFSDTRMASMQRIVDRVTAAFDTCEGVP
jgi:thiamine monophosphate synthase